ncbi:MAG: 3-methyl-2-oxobutanoate hydroxymethyltransferase [Ignavibacteria bacterium]|nr:3-methyl-2-oxobutanoate hydroxymethyltransferase [Ignavibacteria bacterium]
MKTIQEFKSMKLADKKISVVTCYDHWSALILDESDVDAVLVGDSAAMVMHGFDTTINAELEMMRYHVAAVKRGLKNKFLIADLPFLAHKKGLPFLVESVDALMKAGAQAVKLEGAEGNLESIKHLVSAGVPVMGHLGLTPQSINKLGGNKLQGNDTSSSERILKDAQSLEEAGCFAIVLEMVPATLAKTITESLTIPTIGIGAGRHTSGQVLVLQDLLGCSKDFHPKFLRKYLDGFSLIKSALNTYSSDVREQKFPSEKESY